MTNSSKTKKQLILELEQLQEINTELSGCEERYKSLVNASPDAITMSDLKGNITEVSQRTLELHGFHRPEELIGANALELIAPEDHDRAIKNLSKTLKEGHLESVQYTMIKKDQSRFIGELNAALIKDPRGKAKAFVATTRDITDRVRAEKRLRENEHFLENIFESIQDGICVLDNKLNIQRVNRVMKRWYANRVPLEGNKCFRVYHSRSRPCKICPTIRCLESGKMEKDIVPGFPGSPVKWIELFSSPLKDVDTGEAKGVIEIVRDITDHINIENALKESEERFHRLSDASEEGIAIHDRGIIVDANEALARIFGYTHSEVIGMSAENLTTPESWKTILRHITSGFDKPYEGIGVRKNGSNFICQLVGKPFRYRGKNLRVAAIQDITERKRIEEELTKYRERLEDLVETRTTELLKTNDQLRQEISERKKTEVALGKSEALLKKQKRNLEQKNVALREIVAQIEVEKDRIRTDIEHYARIVVLPLLEAIKRGGATRKMVNLLQYHMERMTSSYGSKIIRKSLKLTSREIEICNMIKGGMSSKDIANTLNISHQTIVKHRKNVRKKLGLSSRPVNLASYLRDL